MIREKMMTREEALEMTSLEQTEEPKIYDSFLEELGLSRDDVNEQAEWSR
jgi:hypothetical protein